MADTLTCSRNELAEALDVTPKHIDNLFNAGIVVKQARGEYDVIKSCKNYVKFLRGTNTAEKLDLTEERTRLTRYQADLTHIQLQEAQGAYLPLDLCKAFWQSILTSIKSQLLAIPSALSVDLPHIEQDDIIKIDEKIRYALETASKIPMPPELERRLKEHAASFVDD